MSKGKRVAAKLNSPKHDEIHCFSSAKERGQECRRREMLVRVSV